MTRSNTIVSAAILAVLGLAAGVEWFGESAATAPAAFAPRAADELVARGRYIVKIGGCNDCHTPGYAMSGGKVAEETWLTGDTLGYRGPWGTTYPANLRRYMANLTEDEWVKVAGMMETRPPMPWFTLRDMDERDLRAVYRYVRSLPVTGGPAPDYMPPDREPPLPVFMLVLPR
jgi:mono/diheme cytochrome c family protein